AVLSILTLLASRSNIPSFFSRGRFLRLLRDENQDLDNALRELRKVYYSDYDYFIMIPALVILMLGGIFGKIKLSQETDLLILTIVYNAFLIFHASSLSKLTPLYKKNTKEITEPLRKIVDSTRIANAIIIWVVFVLVLLTAYNSLYNEALSESLLQLTLLSVVGGGVISFILFLSALRIRHIEQIFLFKLNREGKLAPISVKIRLKRQDAQITGNLVTLDFSTFVIQEADGYKLSMEYNKVETVSAKSNQKNKEMS
ncbi:MAG TPA: hypothetical protein VKU94_07525, partial [Geobacterales bacterium]|nr:hypothetical protein [Geobacterales bacterium]